MRTWKGRTVEAARGSLIGVPSGCTGGNHPRCKPKTARDLGDKEGRLWMVALHQQFSAGFGRWSC